MRRETSRGSEYYDLLFRRLMRELRWPPWIVGRLTTRQAHHALGAESDQGIPINSPDDWNDVLQAYGFSEI